MVRDNLGWPDRGEEGDCLMVLHKSSEQLLEAFSETSSFSGGLLLLNCAKDTPNFDLLD